jgi:hypothetical protein
VISGAFNNKSVHFVGVIIVRITVHSRKTKGALKYLQQYVDNGTGFDVKQPSPERD